MIAVIPAPQSVLARAAVGTAARCSVITSQRRSSWIWSLPKGNQDNAAAKRKRQPFRLALLESSIVLGAVDLMFGAFVVVQIAYFFGGQALVNAGTGWTFAQYARRGFFELIAVSVLVLGLILWLDRVTPRTNARQHTIFRVLAVGMIALTGVMLVSASGRMSLYEEAYGYTHLRQYTHTFML